MNLTIVACFMFLSFACCMAIVAWLISKQIPGWGWGWVLFITILFFANVHMKTTDIAECPDCHKVFKIDINKDESE